MELKELNDDERLALVALLEMVMASDATVTREELSQLKHVVRALGAAAYRAIAAEVDARFHDDDQAKAFLLTITRQSARELIYETALEAAMVDVARGREAELLTWLAEQWKLPVRFASVDRDT
jgi:uncharacterized tellurite resistance protein B-like protein